MSWQQMAVPIRIQQQLAAASRSWLVARRNCIAAAVTSQKQPTASNSQQPAAIN